MTKEGKRYRFILNQDLLLVKTHQHKKKHFRNCSRLCGAYADVWKDFHFHMLFMKFITLPSNQIEQLKIRFTLPHVYLCIRVLLSDANNWQVWQEIILLEYYHFSRHGWLGAAHMTCTSFCKKVVRGCCNSCHVKRI